MIEIRMEHPGRNALGTELIAWLDARWDEAGEEPVLFTGTGSAFCAGLNLKQVAASDRRELESFLRGIDALAEKIYLHPAPTVAWVNGHAIAGGCVLALCCDHRVATTNERVRIGMNEVALGACFPPKIRRMMAARIGPRYVEEVMLGAQLYSTAEALERGLVDELAEEGEARARAKLEQLAGHPRAAYALTKRALRKPALAVTAEEEASFLGPELDGWASDEIRARIARVLKR